MSWVLEDEALRDPARAGGKAAALARLAEVAPVPPFLVLPADAFEDGVLRAGAVQELDALPPAEHYAVRSSGTGEDGAAMAHAGQFLSLLGVVRADVAGAAARVHASGAGAAAYRAALGAAGGAAGGVAMAVIVQRQFGPARPGPPSPRTRPRETAAASGWRPSRGSRMR